jgi:hypothetical protein
MPSVSSHIASSARCHTVQSATAHIKHMRHSPNLHPNAHGKTAANKHIYAIEIVV